MDINRGARYTLLSQIVLIFPAAFMFLRHIPFLKSVTLYALTAFGGPQGHFGMMARTFAEKRRDVTEEELLEYTAFANMLPGPSSTQTVMLIALKRGGIPLALVTLGIWVLPAFLIMTALSFVIYYLDAGRITDDLFRFVRPMSVGFILFAALRMTRTSVRHTATAAIMLAAAVATFFLRSPWVFPAVLVAAGMVSNISNRRIPDPSGKPKPIKWVNLWLFFALFLAAGVCSELSRVHKWEYGRAFQLFENFYRFGAIVFGGGQALLGMMLYQFIQHPADRGRVPWLTSSDLLAGYGTVQAVPGPVFSLSTFVGGFALASAGPGWQILGCLIATVAVFLPSTLLLFFFFPIYQNLRGHVIIFRALEGINAAVTGIIWASGLVILQQLWHRGVNWTDLVVIAITFSILQFTRIPAPFVVVGWLLLGWAMGA